MNIPTKMPATADEFLRWNEGREGKREFVRGKVVEMMINVTLDHWRLASRLAQQLMSQLNAEEYDCGSADFGVRTQDGIRFPDVLVIPFGRDGKMLATSSPILVAEVLSPSSIADDFGAKAQDYLALASLRHYLVVSQDEARVWLWSRAEDRAWTKPEMIDGSATHLPGLGVSLDLVRLYAGIAEATSMSS